MAINCYNPLGIPGLFYYPDVLPSTLVPQIVDDLDSRQWDDSISRLTQHYGWRYPYNSAQHLVKADDSHHKGLYNIEESPIISHLINYLFDNFNISSDQCIVNNYYYQKLCF